MKQLEVIPRPSTTDTPKQLYKVPGVRTPTDTQLSTIAVDKVQSQPTRAGVILQSRTSTGIKMYLLGEDGPTGERDAWAGRIEKSDKDAFHAASRELWEETLECVSITPSRIAEGVILRENESLISIVTIGIDELLEYVDKLDEAFSAAKQDHRKTEMRGAKLLTDDELLGCIKNGTMYSVLANVLKKNLALLARS